MPSNAESIPPDPAFKTALGASDHVLSVTRDAYFNNDFNAYSLRFHLPQTLGTFDGETEIATLADLGRVFDAMRAHFAAHGITDLHRRTIEARFISDDLIEATFTSQHLGRAYKLSEPILAHGHLKLIGGVWRIIDSRYATDQPALNQALLGSRAASHPER